MEKFFKNVEEDASKLKRLFASSSLSKKKLLLIDLGDMVSLYNQIGYDVRSLNYDEALAKKMFNGNFNTIVENVYKFEHLADDVIKMYKDMDYYCYLRKGFAALSAQDKKDLLREFLEYFNKGMLSIYDELYNDKRLFITDDTVFGESFLLNQIDKSYIMLSELFMDSLLEVETMAHELAHVYCGKFLQNYSSTLYKELSLGMFGETISIYTELSFYEFLRRKNIFPEAAMLNRNMEDYFTLQFFKTMKYIAEMYKTNDNLIEVHNYQYSVTNANGDESKLKLMIDDGVPFYQYHEELKEGSTIDYNYGLATLDAYKLLRRELNGENPHKLINEYLLSLNKDMLGETLDKYNLDYMNEVISGRLKEIKRRYPL